MKLSRTYTLIGIPTAGALMLAGGALAGYAQLASADATSTASVNASASSSMPFFFHHDGEWHEHGIIGKVTANSGGTITLMGHDGQTYTVTTAGATVHKIATTSVSDIAIGDIIGVHGTITGDTSITASHIIAGLPIHLDLNAHIEQDDQHDTPEGDQGNGDD